LDEAIGRCGQFGDGMAGETQGAVELDDIFVGDQADDTRELMVSGLVAPVGVHEQFGAEHGDADGALSSPWTLRTPSPLSAMGG